jgi:hypothetical protein
MKVNNILKKEENLCLGELFVSICQYKKKIFKFIIFYKNFSRLKPSICH